MYAHAYVCGGYYRLMAELEIQLWIFPRKRSSRCRRAFRFSDDGCASYRLIARSLANDFSFLLSFSFLSACVPFAKLVTRALGSSWITGRGRTDAFRNTVCPLRGPLFDVYRCNHVLLNLSSDARVRADAETS